MLRAGTGPESPPDCAPGSTLPLPKKRKGTTKPTAETTLPSSANQMQPHVKPSSRKENSFSSPPLLLSRLCLAAFPPFGPWYRQRNLKRFPFRGQTRGSPLPRFPASQAKPGLAHPPPPLLFTVPLRIGSLVTKQCSHETLAHFGSQG